MLSYASPLGPVLCPAIGECSCSIPTWIYLPGIGGRTQSPLFLALRDCTLLLIPRVPQPVLPRATSSPATPAAAGCRGCPCCRSTCSTVRLIGLAMGLWCRPPLSSGTRSLPIPLKKEVHFALGLLLVPLVGQVRAAERGRAFLSERLGQTVRHPWADAGRVGTLPGRWWAPKSCVPCWHCVHWAHPPFSLSLAILHRLIAIL